MDFIVFYLVFIVFFHRIWGTPRLFSASFRCFLYVFFGTPRLAGGSFIVFLKMILALRESSAAVFLWFFFCNGRGHSATRRRQFSLFVFIDWVQMSLFGCCPRRLWLIGYSLQLFDGSSRWFFADWMQIISLIVGWLNAAFADSLGIGYILL